MSRGPGAPLLPAARSLLQEGASLSCLLPLQQLPLRLACPRGKKGTDKGGQGAEAGPACPETSSHPGALCQPGPRAGAPASHVGRHLSTRPGSQGGLSPASFFLWLCCQHAPHRLDRRGPPGAGCVPSSTPEALESSDRLPAPGSGARPAGRRGCRPPRRGPAEVLCGSHRPSPSRGPCEDGRTTAPFGTQVTLGSVSGDP